MFYLVIVQNNAICAVYSYNNVDAALAAYHAELAYRNETREKTMCVILDDYGFTIQKEVWEKHVEEES